MGSLGTRERVVKPFTHQPSTAIKRLSRQNSRAHQLAKIRTDQTSREGIGIGKALETCDGLSAWLCDAC